MSFETLTFVFWGYGSEDVLAPLRAHLEAQGLECLAWPDPSLSPAEEVAFLRARPFVLLTSAHFLRDQEILARISPGVRIGASPVELIRECRPVASIFYPHDLGTPLVLVEPQVLPSAFDLVLWPTPHYGYSPPPPRFENVGWIGFHKGSEADREAAAGGRTWLFSDFEHHRKTLGVERTFAKLEPILRRDVAIKFPLWPGHREWEEHFAAQGVRVIPAERNSFGVMLGSSLVLSNGVSGVTFEAVYAGVPVLNLAESYLRPGLQREFLGALRGCRIVSYEDAPDALSKPPPAPPRQIEPFDFDRALRAIREVCEARLQRARALGAQRQ